MRLRCRHAEDQEDQEEHEEQAGQELGDGDRRAGDGGESQQRRDEPDHEKDKRHMEHDFNPPLRTIAKPMPADDTDELRHNRR